MILLATTLALSPLSLVRVEDPDYPGAETSSSTGAVLLNPPPPGIPWRYEAVPQVDGWPAQEALDAMNVAPWHEAGVTGAGVKVAIFDVQWFGAGLEVTEVGPATTHDCYLQRGCELSMDLLRPRFGFEQGSHGLACAEVVHDIAPDAELHLVRVNGRTTLENAVDWALREGIDVVSMSMSFFNQSFYDGTGSISALAERAAAGGMLFVVSSGNYAQSNWQGAYRDSNDDGRMDFEGEDGLWVYLGVGSQTIYINWDEHRRCGRTDLDAQLVDSSGNLLGRSQDRQEADADRCQPIERLTGTVSQAGWHKIEVVRVAGSGRVKVDVLATSGTLRDPMARGSLTDPGASPAAFTVGAVRATEDYLEREIEPFSSQGPNAAGQAKPDIVGPDGVTTQAYGAVGFYGTSAATPAVAGAAALLLSADPSLSPRQAGKRLQDYARSGSLDLGSPDYVFGAGRAWLPEDSGLLGACGPQSALLPVVLLPLAWFRRRRRQG